MTDTIFTSFMEHFEVIILLSIISLMPGVIFAALTVSIVIAVVVVAYVAMVVVIVVAAVAIVVVVAAVAIMRILATLITVIFSDAIIVHAFFIQFLQHMMVRMLF